MKLTDLRRKQLIAYMTSNNITELTIKHKAFLKAGMKRHNLFLQTAELNNGILTVKNVSGLRSNYHDADEVFDWSLINDIPIDGYSYKSVLVKC